MPRPRKPAPPRVLEWQLSGLMLRGFVVGKRKLAITLVHQDGMWTGVGVVSEGTTIAGVFAQHAHAVLEPMADLPSAMAAADEYGNKWLAAAGESIPACDCEDIPELKSEGRLTDEQLEAMVAGALNPPDPPKEAPP